MRESPRVVSRRDIEREVWGDLLPDSDTLRSHLYNLRKVIDKPFKSQLLHTIHSAGYRLADLDAEVAANHVAANAIRLRMSPRSGMRRKIWRSSCCR